MQRQRYGGETDIWLHQVYVMFPSPIMSAFFPSLDSLSLKRMLHVATCRK
jgi:hypothetical protein